MQPACTSHVRVCTVTLWGQPVEGPCRGSPRRVSGRAACFDRFFGCHQLSAIPGITFLGVSGSFSWATVGGASVSPGHGDRPAGRARASSSVRRQHVAGESVQRGPELAWRDTEAEAAGLRSKRRALGRRAGRAGGRAARGHGWRVAALSALLPRRACQGTGPCPSQGRACAWLQAVTSSRQRRAL